MAKLNLYENKIINGEQLLKQVVDENPVHINGLRILIEVMRSLNRSPNSIKVYIQKILQILPDDEDSLALLNTFDDSAQTKAKTAIHSQKVIPLPKKETKAKPIASPPEEIVFDVSVSMATFTMVGILKSQKKYQQALAVLRRLEEKNADPKRIMDERKALEKLLSTE